MTRTVAIRRLISVAGIFVLNAASVFALSVPAASATTVPAASATTKYTLASAARSVDVTYINRTDCDLILISKSLSHGIWTVEPPDGFDIPPNFQGSWASESSGIFTGTEGYATFKTSDCDNRDHRHKNTYLHWDSPWSGSANYSASADQPVEVTYNGTPNSNAVVTFTAEIR